MIVINQNGQNYLKKVNVFKISYLKNQWMTAFYLKE